MKTVIEMAHESLERMDADDHCREPYWTATDKELEAFAALVRTDEREICSALDFRKEIGLTSEQDYKVSQLILFGGNA